MSEKRKLASIQKIEDIKEIPGADSIAIARILGWDVVINKSEFKIGDLCVYCEVDSVLPDWPDFRFLDKGGHRIKAKRYNKFGVISHGLVLPLELAYKYDNDNYKTYFIGDDVTKLFGITKYDADGNDYIVGEQKGRFPSFFPKSDELRVQSYPNVLDELYGKPAYATVKYDGSSCSFYHYQGHFGVCSRNHEIKENEDSILWNIAKRYQLPEIMSEFDMAIQAEIIGPKFNGSGKYSNIFKLNTPDIRVFSVYALGDEPELIRPMQFCDSYDIPCVETVYIWKSFNETIESLTELSKGNYTGTNVPREGIVIRPMETFWSNVLQKPLSFKMINPDFELAVENKK